MKTAKLILVVLVLCFASSAFAVPTVISHQGRVLSSNGEPMSGVTGITFKLFSGATGGSALWTQSMDVTFDDGHYSVVLGPGTPSLSTDFFDGSDLYLEVTIDGADPFGPRHRVVSVPYAMRAGSVTGEVVAVGGLVVDGQELVDGDGKLATTDLEVSGTLTVPRGPLGDLPSASEDNKGQLYYATDVDAMHYSDGTEWLNLSTGGGGNGDLLRPSLSSLDPSQIQPEEDVSIVLSGNSFEDGLEVTFNRIYSEDVSFANATEATAMTGAELVSGTYNVSVTNPNGLRDILVDGLVVDALPVWVTEEGSLGSLVDVATGEHYTFEATDAEGQSLTYTLTGGALPPGMSLDSNTGIISGDPDDVSESTTSDFEITLADGARTPNEEIRSFSITIIHGLGLGPENPGQSCKEILDSGAHQGDGLYWLKPTDNPAFQAYCDMSTEGGGWTLVEMISTSFSINSTYWAASEISPGVLPQFASNPNQTGRLNPTDLNGVCTSGDGYVRHFFANNTMFLTDWFHESILSGLDIAYAIRGDSSYNMGFRGFGNGNLTATATGNWRRYNGPLSENRVCTGIHSYCGGAGRTHSAHGPLCDSYGCDRPGQGRTVEGHMWWSYPSNPGLPHPTSYGTYGTYGSRWCR